MMFMIPMPPTTSEIEAIPPSSSVSVALIDDAAASSWVWLKTLKSAVSVGGEVVAVAQQRRDRGLGRGHLVRVGDADTPIVRTRVAADEVLLHDADRDEDLVVGVLEAGAALGLEDADDLERQAADRDLASRCRWRRGRGSSRSSRRGRRRGGPASTLGVGQEGALPDVVGADRRIGRGRADDGRGRRLGAGRDGQAGRDLRARRRRSTAACRSRSRRRAVSVVGRAAAGRSG